MENVAEGCVREAWGALEAHHQARFATWPALRRAMAGIAEEEAHHAELAFDLHAWALTALPMQDREQVRQAGEEAVVRLSAVLGQGRAAALLEEGGLPDATRAQALLRALAAGVLSA